MDIPWSQTLKCFSPDFEFVQLKVRMVKWQVVVKSRDFVKNTMVIQNCVQVSWICNTRCPDKKLTVANKPVKRRH